MLRLFNQLDIYRTQGTLSYRLMRTNTKLSQASWILCSVNTPCDQSETLRTACMRHLPVLCRRDPRLSSTGGSSWDPCHRCLYFLPTAFHCSKCGWPGRWKGLWVRLSFTRMEGEGRTWFWISYLRATASLGAYSGSWGKASQTYFLWIVLIKL